MKISNFNPELGLFLTGGTATTISAAASNTYYSVASNLSASFGSNATSIGANNAGGSGSGSSRSDHVHQGIGTVTASSSNTLDRPTLNLRPGNNIAFALSDSDGNGAFDTLTLISTASGGGGAAGSNVLPVVREVDLSPSVGNVTTLQFPNGMVTDLGGGVVGIDARTGAALAAGKAITTAHFDSSSTTFVDVTGASVTLTTGARRCLITVAAHGYYMSGQDQLRLDVAVDGTTQGYSNEGLFSQLANTSSHGNLGGALLTDVLTAGSHTFKLQWRTASGTARLARGATISVQELPDAQIGGALSSASYKRTSGDYTTTSDTFVDVDGTNMAHTIRTGARRVMIGFAGHGGNGTSGSHVFVDVAIDGTRHGGTYGITGNPQATNRADLSFVIVSDVLTAGSHTFKLQFRRYSAGTATIYGSSADGVCQFWVQELPDLGLHGSGPLARQSYAAGTDTSLATTSSSTFADVDATNAIVSFTVPASGAVIVHAQALVNPGTPSSGYYWTLREGTTNLTGTSVYIGNDGNALTRSVRMHVTGLTPGANLTYKLGHRTTSGTATVYTGPAYGPIVMEVWPG